jgi:hypothetical protein
MGELHCGPVGEERLEFVDEGCQPDAGSELEVGRVRELAPDDPRADRSVDTV